MMLSLYDHNIKRGLYLLLFTAAETLFDGTYHLDGRTRRSPKVIEAGNVLHELSQALGNDLLDDASALEHRLVEVARIFDQLATIDVDVISLMVRRDYATAQRREQAGALRRRDGKSSRGLLQVVSRSTTSDAESK